MKVFVCIAGFISALVSVSAVELIDLQNGYAATVRNSSSAPQLLSAINESDAELVIHDRMTGVVLCKSEHAKQVNFAGVSSVFSGSTLYTKSDQTLVPVARSVGVEKKKGGKVLPLSYIRFRTTGQALASGTLLYNKEEQVVGVVYINDRLIENQGYAVPIQAVLRVGEDYTKNRSVSRCWVGLVTTSSTNVPEIASVRPGSPAALAGIKKGDILVQVGDWQVQSYLDAVNAFYYLIAGEVEKFSIVRGAELMTFFITPISRDALVQE